LHSRELTIHTALTPKEVRDVLATHTRARRGLFDLFPDRSWIGTAREDGFELRRLKRCPEITWTGCGGWGLLT